jgi:glycosyltransferase involved in cell wall biosynthesis
MRALVVIPTYDEADNLVEVVDRLRGAAGPVHILIVDDASPDGTGQLADRLATSDPYLDVLHRAGKLGLGSAYRTGFVWGLARGFDALVEMDADLSHDPADVPRLLAALAGADLVIGSRYVPGGGVVDWPARRRRLSRGGNRYVRAMTGMPVTDATSGFRAVRADAVQALGLTAVRSEGYCFQVDMALRTWRAGYRVIEVPITFVERRAGASKISRRIVVEAVLRTAQWGVAGPRRPNPPPVGHGTMPAASSEVAGSAPRATAGGPSPPGPQR